MQTVFITGGARGIGRELARLFKEAGDQVIVGVRDPASAAGKLDGCEVVALDVGSDESAKALARQLGDRPIDILINNAGVIGPEQQSAEAMDFNGFLQTLNVNTLGPLRVTQALLPNLKKSQRARVAIITSRMGALSVGAEGHMAYRASKAAVNKVAQGLASELKKDGVAVVSLHPGWVRTDMGGPGADISVEESASGIKAVIDGLKPETSGQFRNYDGKELAW